MNNKYENYNRELKRAWDISSESYLSDPYLSEIEDKLGEFHKGLVIFAKVDQQIGNGGFDGLFYNEYMDALEEAISFLDEIRDEPELEQYADKVINLFEEAIEVRTYFTDKISDLDTMDEWYDDTAELIEKSCSNHLDHLGSKYSKIDENLSNRLELLIERRFVKQPLS